MRHSLYIQLAKFLLLADVKAEQRKWQKNARRTQYMLPYESKHLLKDVGLDRDGFANKHYGVTVQAVERRVRLMRYVLRSRLVT